MVLASPAWCVCLKPALVPAGSCGSAPLPLPLALCSPNLCVLTKAFPKLLGIAPRLCLGCPPAGRDRPSSRAVVRVQDSSCIQQCSSNEQTIAVPPNCTWAVQKRRQFLGRLPVVSRSRDARRLAKLCCCFFLVALVLAFCTPANLLLISEVP